MEVFRLMKELKLNLEQESQYLPKESGLRLIESNPEVQPPGRAGTSPVTLQPSVHTRPNTVICLKGLVFFFVQLTL